MRKGPRLGFGVPRMVNPALGFLALTINDFFSVLCTAQKLQSSFGQNNTAVGVSEPDFRCETDILTIGGHLPCDQDLRHSLVIQAIYPVSKRQLANGFTKLIQRIFNSGELQNLSYFMQLQMKIRYVCVIIHGNIIRRMIS